MQNWASKHLLCPFVVWITLSRRSLSSSSPITVLCPSPYLSLLLFSRPSTTGCLISLTATTMFGRHRKPGTDPSDIINEHDIGMSNSADVQGEKHAHHVRIPKLNHNGHKVTRGIKPDGESGRAWIHPRHFFRICYRSSSHASTIVNWLWPFVPAAIAMHFARPDLPLWVFSLNYIAMVPTANLIGFAGQELARKLPKVAGKQCTGILNECSLLGLPHLLGEFVPIQLLSSDAC